jgi:hypothetical protein
MSTYQIEGSEEVRNHNELIFRMNEIRIITPDGKIPLGKDYCEVLVTDGTNEVRSFRTIHTLNEKVVMGNFTTDAFTAFTGNVDVHLDISGLIVASFENINLATLIQPLPPYLAALNAPDADNAWLATI